MDDFFGESDHANVAAHENTHSEEPVRQDNHDIDVDIPAAHDNNNPPATFTLSQASVEDKKASISPSRPCESINTKTSNILANVEAEHRRLVEERREHNRKLQADQRSQADAFWNSQRTQRASFLKERVESNLQHTRKVLEQRDELFERGTLWQKVQSMTSCRAKDERGKKQGRIREIISMMNV